MKQPDMAFVLCQESSHLQAGALAPHIEILLNGAAVFVQRFLSKSKKWSLNSLHQNVDIPHFLTLTSPNLTLHVYIL
jgi:hypothetical protein